MPDQSTKPVAISPDGDGKRTGNTPSGLAVGAPFTLFHG
jgi:hypothetical protein